MTDPKTMTDAELNAECARLAGFTMKRPEKMGTWWFSPKDSAPWDRFVYPPFFTSDRNAIAEWLWPVVEKSALHLGQFMVFLRQHAEGRMAERPLSAGHEFNGWQWHIFTASPRVQAEAFVEVMRGKQ